MVKISKPPLILFTLRLQFPKTTSLTFEKMADVDSLLKQSYPKVPLLNLLESIKGKILDLPLEIKPIIYKSQKDEREIWFFSDAIELRFNKYDRWENVKKQLETIFRLFEIIKVELLNGFRIEYVDEFKIASDHFKLEDYFKIFSHVPEDWKLNYRDFYLGIHIKSEIPRKFIFRLRGLSSEEEYYKFRLESIYLENLNSFLLNDKNQKLLLEKLDSAHDEIIENFLKVLSDRTKKEIIGVDDSESD